MFEKRKRREKQSEFWVQRERLPAAVASAFYRRVNATLEKMDFARQVWAICEPAYADPARGGRPGIDPVVYLKMLMIGFFENSASPVHPWFLPFVGSCFHGGFSTGC